MARMSQKARVERLDSAIGRFQCEIDGTDVYLCAVARCIAGRGTWDDARLALKDAIDGVLPGLISQARAMPDARARGHALQPEGVGRSLIAIMSYRPDEDVPPNLHEAIEVAATQSWSQVPALLAMVLLETPDGMALREQIWGDRPPGVPA